MIQNNHSKAMDSSVTLSEGAPVWARSFQELDKNDVTVRVIKLILNMTDEDRLDLLKDLEGCHFAEAAETSSRAPIPHEEMREHPRKESLIAVDCKTHDVCFTNFIKDISNGGVFIETHAHFYVGQRLKMIFSLPESEHPHTVNGKVVRINHQGIGVQFIGGDMERIDVKI
jgi:Tfp pilus assembly protein PilZ